MFASVDQSAIFADPTPGLRESLLVRPGRIRSVDIARIALERALLPPSRAARPSASVLGFGEGRAVVCYTLAEFANEREWIEKLLGWYMRGMRQPVHAFPNCAQAFAEAWVKGKGASRTSQAAEKAWLGKVNTRKESTPSMP